MVISSVGAKMHPLFTFTQERSTDKGKDDDNDFILFSAFKGQNQAGRGNRLSAGAVVCHFAFSDVINFRVKLTFRYSTQQ